MTISPFYHGLLKGKRKDACLTDPNVSVPEPRYSPGDTVQAVSARHLTGAIVGPAVRRQGQFWYPVFFGGEQTETLPEEDMEPYVGAGDVRSSMRNGRFAGRESLSRLVTQLKLSFNLSSQVYAMSASRTDFYPYQFKPLLKFIESRNNRLLIADEVGLGKTIEAGLILTELRHRRPELARILIVPPAHLRHKWREEMRRRFERHFEILDAVNVLEFLDEYERESGETHLWGIVSLETLRSARVMEKWEAVGPEIDLVVFDEAGRLRNAGTRSQTAAEIVGENSDAVLLLTATPVQTKAEDLFHLLRLLDPEGFARPEVFEEQLRVNSHVLAAQSELRRPAADPRVVSDRLTQVERSSLALRFVENPLYKEVVARLGAQERLTRQARVELQRDLEGLTVFGHVLSRTRRRDVNEKQPERRARVWHCHGSSDEVAFYAEVTRICREAYGMRRDGRGASFGIIQAQRQMASCMSATVNYINDRIRGMVMDDAEFVDVDPDESVSGSGDLIQPDWAALGDLEGWRERLDAYDSKLEALRDVICTLSSEEPGAKILVFTFFRRTAFHIRRRLNDSGVNALAMTGDTPTNPANPELDERVRIIERFRSNPSVQVLIATNVADEGLDLQFAHCMVNYDLPWNPMRIEQRIGRVDRIGQKSDVIQIVNLSMPNTIEDRILTLLYERINIFEQSIGDLEMIMGDVIGELQKKLFEPELAPEEEEEKIKCAADTLEHKVQESIQIEERAHALIGQDDFFTDEIERVRTHRRYITGEELVVYLGDYLKEHHRECRLHPHGKNADLYRLTLGDGLRRAVRAVSPPGDPELIQFLTRAKGDQLVLTTNPTQAEDDPRLSLLTFYNPLVRTVHKHYSDHLSQLHPACYVRLRSDFVPASRYAWLLYLSEIGGARPRQNLELVALDLQGRAAVDEDDSETLLWQMVTEAESVPESRRRLELDADVLDLAEDLFVSRFNARFESTKRLNDALVANRLASLRETYQRNREIRERRVQEARQRGRKASYIKGLETRIRTLESGFEKKEREIKANRERSRNYKLCAGGIVEVSHGT